MSNDEQDYLLLVVKTSRGGLLKMPPIGVAKCLRLRAHVRRAKRQGRFVAALFAHSSASMFASLIIVVRSYLGSLCGLGSQTEGLDLVVIN